MSQASQAAATIASLNQQLAQARQQTVPVQNQLREPKELQAQQKQLRDQIQRELASQQSLQQQFKGRRHLPPRLDQVVLPHYKQLHLLHNRYSRPWET